MINEVVALAETEAELNSHHIVLDQQQLSKQYNELTELANHTLEPLALGERCFMLVAKPLDEAYYNKRNRFDFNQKGLSKVINKLRSLGVNQYVGSTEVMASKVHHNVIFRCRDHAIQLEHDKVWFHKWKIYLKPVDNFQNAIEYIYKEALSRFFTMKWDYQMYKPIRKEDFFFCGKPSKTKKRKET